MEEQDFQRRTGKVMIIAGWVLVLGLLTFYFSDFLADQHNPNQLLETAQTANAKEVRLERNRFGHYVATGSINDSPVTFLLDTGATQISIPANIAKRLQLKAGIAVPVMTANGQIDVYMTRLNRVSLGDIEVRDVRANINPYMDTDEILLGMSFLKHLDFSQQGNELIIRQVNN